MKPGRTRPENASFTLVELMAAMTVLTLLMVALMAMLDQATKAWQASHNQIQARREARTALQLLAEDLKGLQVGAVRYDEITVTTNTNVTPPTYTTNINNLYLWPRPIFLSYDPELSSRLTFLTHLPARSQGPGEPDGICGVQYFVAYTNGAFWLMRRLQMTRRTFTNLTTTPKFQRILTNQLPSFQAQELFSADDGSNCVVEPLAANVIYFRAELKISATNQEIQGDVTNNRQTYVTITNNTINRPDQIQMELTAYPPRATVNFTNREDWFKTNNIQKLAKTYLWRIAP